MKNRLKLIIMAGIFSVHTITSVGMVSAGEKKESTEIEVQEESEQVTEKTIEVVSTVETEVLIEEVVETEPETESTIETEAETEVSTESESSSETDTNESNESEKESSSEGVTEKESMPEESEKEKEEKKKQEAEKEFKEKIGETLHDFSYYPIGNITENTNEIYDYLTKKMGLNHAAACGVLANIQCESNFASTAVGDGGTSYGLCQWHLERFSALVAFCNANGYDFHTIEGQLAYLKQELENNYSGVYEYILNVPNSAKGAYDAAYYWCVNYEIPSDTHYKGVVRANLAENEFFPKKLGTKKKKRLPQIEKSELTPADMTILIDKAPEEFMKLSRLEITMEEAVWSSVK